jgi:hypothetical protein
MDDLAGSERPDPLLPEADFFATLPVHGPCRLDHIASGVSLLVTVVIAGLVFFFFFLFFFFKLPLQETGGRLDRKCVV